MRIVEFKAHDEDIFERYVDIGFCDRDYYILCIYRNEEGSVEHNHSLYEKWYFEFKTNEIGSQMLTLNYYLRNYHEQNDIGPWVLSNNPNIFIDIYGEKINKVISDNYDFFMEFNNKWFIHQSCLFDGLDLGWPEDIDDLISERIGETEDEITEVKFEDGSIMKFLDSNDTICSFYVLESDFTLLKTEIETIVNKFE